MFYFRGRGGVGVLVHCGHVNTDRMIIHEDSPNQKFCGGGVKWGQSRGTRQGQGCTGS